MTQVGRGAAVASIKGGRLGAFFIFHTARESRLGSVGEELRHAFSGAGWHTERLLDRIPDASSVYFNDVAQVICPRWASDRVILPVLQRRSSLEAALHWHGGGLVLAAALC